MFVDLISCIPAQAGNNQKGFWRPSTATREWRDRR